MSLSAVNAKLPVCVLALKSIWPTICCIAYAGALTILPPIVSVRFLKDRKAVLPIVVAIVDPIINSLRTIVDYLNMRIRQLV